jgi:hypothetical protein
MAVVVTVPWMRATLGFALLVLLATTPQKSRTTGQATQDRGYVGPSDDKRGESRWLPDWSIKLMGDTASRVLELGLHANTQQVTLFTTGLLDAVLHDPPPERQPTHNR